MPSCYSRSPRSIAILGLFLAVLGFIDIQGSHCLNLDCFRYRRRITVGNTGGLAFSGPLLVSLDTSLDALVNSSMMTPEYSDLRFLDNLTDTLVDFWIEDISHIWLNYTMPAFSVPPSTLRVIVMLFGYACGSVPIVDARPPIAWAIPVSTDCPDHCPVMTEFHGVFPVSAGTGTTLPSLQAGANWDKHNHTLVAPVPLTVATADVTCTSPGAHETPRVSHGHLLTTLDLENRTMNVDRTEAQFCRCEGNSSQIRSEVLDEALLMFWETVGNLPSADVTPRLTTRYLVGKFTGRNSSSHWLSNGVASRHAHGVAHSVIEHTTVQDAVQTSFCLQNLTSGVFVDKHDHKHSIRYNYCNGAMFNMWEVSGIHPYFGIDEEAFPYFKVTHGFARKSNPDLENRKAVFMVDSLPPLGYELMSETVGRIPLLHSNDSGVPPLDEDPLTDEAWGHSHTYYSLFFFGGFPAAEIASPGSASATGHTVWPAVDDHQASDAVGGSAIVRPPTMKIMFVRRITRPSSLALAVLPVEPRWGVCGGVMGWNVSSVCGGHGDCLVGPNCTSCRGGWTGQLCEEHECFGHSYLSGEVCTGRRGVCHTNHTCECIQPELHFGPACEHQYCNGTGSDMQSTVCNGNGECIATDVCRCDVGFDNSTMCAEPFVCGNNGLDAFPSQAGCSNHGVCVGDNVCQCNSSAGYFGANCSLWMCFLTQNDLPSVCSTHGDCVSPNECRCHKGYINPDCDTLHYCAGVAASSPNICNRHGECDPLQGFCSCDSGWQFDPGCTYTKCNDVRDYYLGVCNANGVCEDLDKCKCDPGFSGKWCTEWNGTGRGPLTPGEYAAISGFAIAIVGGIFCCLGAVVVVAYCCVQKAKEAKLAGNPAKDVSLQEVSLRETGMREEKPSDQDSADVGEEEEEEEGKGEEEKETSSSSSSSTSNENENE